MLNKQHKAQLSIFIVIGAILLIVMGFLISNSNIEFFESSQTKNKKQIISIIESCIETSARNGVFLLGFQGGVITIDDAIKANPLRYINFGNENDELSLKIPNWDTQRGGIPTLTSMQEELSDFIEENSRSCITSNLDPLQQSYYDIDIKADLSVKAEIKEEDVIIEASMPIIFNEKNNPEKLSVSKYIVNLEDIKLGKLFALAANIYNYEARTYFIEELVLDQIYSASDYRSPLSMPGEGISISCRQFVWTKDQLKRNLANLNNNNFKYLYLKGTQPITDIMDANLNDEFGTTELREYFEKQYVFDLDVKGYGEISVDVNLPSVEITGNEGFFQRYPFREFEVNPSSGQLVKSQKLETEDKISIPIPCIQVFHHLYTLDYDLLFKLTDNSENSQGYFFQFPLRVKIENNNPKTRTATPFIPNEKLTATNEVFCAAENRKTPIILHVKDALTGDILPNVNVSYKCVGLTCNIGTTFTREYQHQAYLEEDFPYCFNGVVTAKKKGYHNGKLRLTTDGSVTADQIELAPLKTFKMNSASQFNVIDRETGQTIQGKSEGTIFVTLENKAYDFTSEAIYPSEEGFLDTLSFLVLDNVKYNVSAFYVNKDNQFQGLLELKDWEPNIYSGSVVKVNIPAVSSGIDESNYEDFTNYMEERLAAGSSSQVEYGIVFR